MACKLAVISGMAFEAHMAKAPGIQTIYGLNPQRLETDIGKAIKDGAVGLLSFGTAAGLSPMLSPGAIIVARTVRWQEQSWQADAMWTQRLCAALPDAQLSDIAAVDLPLAHVRDKIALYETSQAAVSDMESHHVARMAQHYHISFATLRVVLDGVNRTLPSAALAALREDGSVAHSAVIRSLFAAPRQLPLLLQLAGDQRMAKKSLLRTSDLLKGRLFMYPG